MVLKDFDEVKNELFEESKALGEGFQPDPIAAIVTNDVPAQRGDAVAVTPYTGNGFDIATTDAGASADHTLSVPAGVVTNFVLIEVTALMRAYSSCAATNASGQLALKIEGGVTGSLSTLFDRNICSSVSNDTDGSDTDTCNFIKWYWVPSDVEKATGFDVKFTFTATGVAGGSYTITVTNDQVMIYAY